MRSLWGKAPFQFELREIETPHPGPGEVLVKVEACGICGTDVHFVRSGEFQEWRPLGHEAVGTVAEVGPGVGRFRGGETVIVQNHVECGLCPQCKNGQPQYCQNIRTYMEDRAGFADYLCVQADMIQPYEGLTPIQATLAEPLTVALDLTLTADPALNDEVAVFGPGSIGLITVRLAKLRGARRVFLTGSNRSTPRGRHRLEAGKEMGADITLADKEDDIVAVIKGYVPQGVDQVLITAPPRTFLQAIQIARFGGVIGLIGIQFGEGAFVTFNVNEFHFKKLQLRASHAIPNHRFPMALDLLARKAVDPDKLITHVFHLDEAEEAFRTLIDPKQEAIKVVIIP
ncbi:MAG: zinc-binding dehydrogenase [Anaerolineae bacterium]